MYMETSHIQQFKNMPLKCALAGERISKANTFGKCRVQNPLIRIPKIVKALRNPANETPVSPASHPVQSFVKSALLNQCLMVSIILDCV